MDDFKYVIQPNNLKKDLFIHQLVSIYNMEKFEINKKIQKKDEIKKINFGILSDIVGFGKTLSIIGLICRNKMDWDLTIPYNKEIYNTTNCDMICTMKINKYIKLNTTLILTSKNIINQWYEELSLSNLKIFKLDSYNKIDNFISDNFDVVLVLPKYYNDLVNKYKNYAWKRFIFDEPSNVKILNMKTIITGFSWFITSTPELILYKHKNCKKTNFIRKIFNCESYNFYNVFSDLIVKNPDDFIKNSFNLPKTYNLYYNCFQPIYNIVKDFTNNEIQLLIESDNIDLAIKLLGGKKSDNIVNLIKNNLLKEIEDSNNIELIKKNKTKINNLDNKFQELLNSNCSICLSQIKNPVLESNCQNIFCGKCLLSWLSINNNKNCPLCRKKIIKKNLIYIQDKKTNNNKNKKTNNKIKTKLQTIIEIINNKKEGFFLIFSSYNNTFKPIKDILKSNNISFSEIKGTSNCRKNIINNFKNGNIKVLFLNSIYDGHGINLQECTDIILYHKINNKLKSQIVGRANRIGRTNELYIHNLEILKDNI